MMAMQEVYVPNVLAASLNDLAADDIMQKRKELYQISEEQIFNKLKKDSIKLKKNDSFTVKVGLIMPDKTGEARIQAQSQWWEEEMKRREALVAQQAEKEAADQEELRELQEKEDKLAALQASWQAKVDEIRLDEDELTTITKDFENKVNMEMKARMEQASASTSSGNVQNHRTIRMQEEATRKAAKKALRDGSGNPEQEARAKLFINIEQKNELEREIARAQKDVGLMKQRIRLRERAHEQIMDGERTRRIENGPRDMPSLEELYAPKVVPPRPVIERSHVSRMEEAKREREARRAARMASSSSSSSTVPGTAHH